MGGRARATRGAQKPLQDGRGPGRQPADHRALGHRQRGRPRASFRPDAPGRERSRELRPRRDRPRRLPRPEPQRHAEPGLGPPVARPDDASSRSPATTRSRATRACPKPVFDIDSVALLAAAAASWATRRRRQGRRRRRRRIPSSTASSSAARSTPSSASSATSSRSSSSSRSRCAAGADYAITQVGYDARRQDELLRWMRREGIAMPVVGNAYILSAPGGPGVQRRQGRRAASSPTTCSRSSSARPQAADKGRAFFLEFAAKQLVVARGLGFRGIYICGPPGRRRDRPGPRAGRRAPGRTTGGRWSRTSRGACRAPSSPSSSDGDGLSTDELDPAYARSLTPAARARGPRAGWTRFYKVNRDRPRARVRARARPASAPGSTVYEKVEQFHARQAAPRARAGGQGADVRLPRLRRLLAAGHRVPVPGEPLPEEPAQRPLRRRARRACARSPATPASGPTPTGASSRTARSARCSSGRPSSRTTTCGAPAPGGTRSSGATTIAPSAARPRSGRRLAPAPAGQRPPPLPRPSPQPAAPEKGPTP